MLRQDNGQIVLDGYCQVDEGYGNGEHYEHAKSGLSWLPISSRGYLGGVSDLDTVILNPKDSQYVKATYIHVWNTTVQLTQVLSDITGTTGLQIIRAIVAGERDPQGLARLRHGRCQRSEAEIAKALSGYYRPEHVFALKQALALYDFYTAQVQECDTYIEQHYAVIKPTYDEPPPPLGPDHKPNSHAKNAPAFDVRACLYRILGFDLTATEGLEASSAQVLLSEIGTDMSKWPTEKHFASWLGLAPHNDISGGKVLRSKPLKGNRRAAQALRLAAQTLGRTQTALGSCLLGVYIFTFCV